MKKFGLPVKFTTDEYAEARGLARADAIKLLSRVRMRWWIDYAVRGETVCHKFTKASQFHDCFSITHTVDGEARCAVCGELRDNNDTDQPTGACGIPQDPPVKKRRKA